MFGVDSGELFIIILVAVVVIGPKDLPRVMRTVGEWVGKARGMANQFRSGVDQMVRDAEIEDLEKKWREQNEAIMRAHPIATDSGWGLPTPPAGVEPTVSLDKPDAPAPSAAPLLSRPVAVTPPREEPSSPAPATVTGAVDRRAAPSAVPPLVRPAYPAPRVGGEAA